MCPMKHNTSTRLTSTKTILSLIYCRRPTGVRLLTVAVGQGYFHTKVCDLPVNEHVACNCCIKPFTIKFVVNSEMGLTNQNIPTSVRCVGLQLSRSYQPPYLLYVMKSISKNKLCASLHPKLIMNQGHGTQTLLHSDLQFKQIHSKLFSFRHPERLKLLHNTSTHMQYSDSRSESHMEISILKFTCGQFCCIHNSR